MIISADRVGSGVLSPEHGSTSGLEARESAVGLQVQCQDCRFWAEQHYEGWALS